MIIKFEDTSKLHTQLFIQEMFEHLKTFDVYRSQMISKEDYDFIAAFDSSDTKTRENKLKENSHQAAKTFLNLLGHVSKDQTIQYILTMIDDMLQV